MYAHFDKSYFLEKDRPKLGEKAPVLYGEMLTLLQTAVETINYYSRMLDKSVFALENLDITKDVDTLFMVLHNFIKK